MDSLVRVLIVDDSAYVRKVIRQILERSPFVEVVGAARDGAEALELVEQLNPDVITLDLIMPRVDGMTFLREQMRRRPLPVIIVTVTSEEGELVLQALEAGAVDMVRKPTALATEKVFEIGDELIESVKAAARVRVQALRTARPDPALPAQRPATAKRDVDVIVIGVSTGGPQALRYLIPQLPANFAVPIAIVLHMPIGYTELYAQKLAEISRIEVAEAKAGAEFRPGLALIAPAGRHMTFRRSANGTIRAHLDPQPSDTIHRPSVDVLFQSAAEVYGERVLAVVMTGMGSDGQQGAAWIKARGGIVFTEAEESCIVYGMPRSVVEAGLSDRSIPLARIAQSLVEMV